MVKSTELLVGNILEYLITAIEILL